EISWRFRARRGEVGLCVRRSDEGEPQVRRVKTSWTAGGRPAALTFAPAGPAHLGATPEGYDAEVKVLALPTNTRAGLVPAELQRLEPDRVFQSALLISRKLAANLSL